MQEGDYATEMIGIPAAHTPEILDLSPKERKSLSRPPSAEDIAAHFRHPLHAAFMARVKRAAREMMNEAFTGLEVPGIAQHTPRDAYYRGGVTFARLVVNTQREMLEEALRESKGGNGQPPAKESSDLEPSPFAHLAGKPE